MVKINYLVLGINKNNIYLCIMKTTITTQSELDALPLDFEGDIYITGNIETFNHNFEDALVYVKDKAVIQNHNGGNIYEVRDNAVIENHNGGWIGQVYDNAVIENHNGGWIRSVSDYAVIKKHNGGWINWVRDNAVIENNNGGWIGQVYDNAVIENHNGGWIGQVYDNAVIENHNGGTIYNVFGKAAINTCGGIIYYKANQTNITINTAYGSFTEGGTTGSSTEGGTTGSSTEGGTTGSSTEGGTTEWFLRGGNNGGTVIVIPPCDNTFEWFKKSFPVETKGEYAILYKAVRKRDGKYYSYYDENFEYIIGEEKTTNIDTDVNNECSFGIHISHKHWAIKFGCEWPDITILELRVLIKDIVIPTKCDGKVRTSKAFVVREVPQSEW